MAMREGVCPICGSDEVYVGTTRSAGTRAGAYAGNAIPINWASNAPMENYVCVDCGYVESYILERTSLEKIRQLWERADGTKRKNDE